MKKNNIEAKKSQKEEKNIQKSEKRQKQYERLARASADAKILRDKLTEEAKTINESLRIASLPLNFFITNYIYKEDGITEFNQFKQWQEKGFQVKKGEKAFPIWGKPIRREQAENELPEDDFFPICYVFSNLQVQ